MPQLKTRILGGLLFATLLFATACSTSLYKVKSIAERSEMPADAATAEAGSLSFRAAPLLTDEQSQELFEANLQLAGLLPVRVEITHNASDVIEFKKVRFRLTDGSGAVWKTVTGKQAVSRVLKANGVKLYNPNFRKEFETELQAHELDVKSPLQSGKRTGLLFFQSPRKEAVTSPHGLVLSVEGLAQPVTLTLK